MSRHWDHERVGSCSGYRCSWGFVVLFITLLYRLRPLGSQPSSQTLHYRPWPSQCFQQQIEESLFDLRRCAHTQRSPLSANRLRCSDHVHLTEAI
ncbi:hypothetical protein DOTSEDRAFT_69006 [Dothistroma septosporum NZE10]|uniref:Uncharacterized protein n=1 Tax=Dothistroma septosporum (strain NZE10 / CBS 128990) TaxID=675120 RepID=N1Q5H0_DOTSN|nr:hypothetical protein DOTSEDRAFT_69006 [Dothistroma septosporum NZE10]